MSAAEATNHIGGKNVSKGEGKGAQSHRGELLASEGSGEGLVKVRRRATSPRSSPLVTVTQTGAAIRKFLLGFFNRGSGIVLPHFRTR